MGRNDWYRRTTWTPEDAEEFHARNGRSRGDANKAQYLRIQADTLLRTGDDDLLGSALELSQLALEKSPGTLSHAPALDCAGRCYERLGESQTAIQYFLDALEYQRQVPGIRTNACFHLGRVVATTRAREFYDVAWEALEDFGAPIFPWHSYMINGIGACIRADQGDVETARQLAQTALASAAVRESGLGWGRSKLGLVSDTTSHFHGIIEELAV